MGQITNLLTEDRELPVEVGLHDQVAKGRDLAKLLVERRDLEEQRKEQAAQHKAAVAELDGKIAALRDVVAGGRELRMVQVRHLADHDTMRVRVVRSDTGEVLADRPMTQEERQLPIDFVTPPDNPSTPPTASAEPSGD